MIFRLWSLLQAFLRGGALGQYNFRLDTKDAGNLQKLVITLRLTDLQANLIANINGVESLKNKTDELEERLSDLQAIIAQEQYKYNTIQRSYNLAESIYQTYNEQYRQALAMETSNRGNINIKIISEAVVPTNAYNRNFMMIEAVAGCLGLFISIFAVLFYNYWKSAETGFADSKVKAMRQYS